MVTSSVQPLPREVVDLANKTRSNLFAWRGQFSPELVDALIEEYAPPHACILDPFAGSGTVLVECARHSFPAVGVEINPAAATLARTYEFANLSIEERQELLRALDDRLRQEIRDDLPLWGGKQTDSGDVLQPVLEIIRGTGDRRQRTVLEALVILLDVFRKPPQPADVLAEWSALSRLVRSLPYSRASIRAHVADARALPVATDQVGFVVTSPPYINVFNYHQQYRASAELLGWKLLSVAKSEIGANRKHRQNRFLTVCQYCLDMHQVLIEMSRVCKEGAHAIFVVGRESNVRKTRFFNSDIVKCLAVDCVGWRHGLQQERSFTNRFGQRIREDILHFFVQGAPVDSLRQPRDVAKRFLTEALERVPDDSRSDLRAALEQLPDVSPSPLLLTGPIRTPGFPAFSWQ